MRRSLIPNPNKSPLLQRLLRKAPAASKRNVTAIVFNKVETVENKMKWTNVLYKAEGLKIKDNEDKEGVGRSKREYHGEDAETAGRDGRTSDLSDIFTTILTLFN